MGRSELSKRILTGGAGALFLTLWVVFGGWFGVFLLTVFLALGMLLEFSEICFSLSDQVEKKYVLLSMAWALSVLNFLFPLVELSLLALAFIVLFTYFLWTSSRHSNTHLVYHFREFVFALFGLIYIVFLSFYLPKIYEGPYGKHWLLLFLYLVWSGDTGAYFIGKNYGKTFLLPNISPKKTWEGAIGGWVVCVMTAFLFKLCFFCSLSFFAVLGCASAVNIVAQIGDLCESFFKRSFQRKDTGRSLPGHGGFLDRFDGLLLSAPIMYICSRIFN